LVNEPDPEVSEVCLPVDGMIRDGWTGQETAQHLPCNRGENSECMNCSPELSVSSQLFHVLSGMLHLKHSRVKTVTIRPAVAALIWIGSIAPM
jgi:hypothetical protein